VVRKTATLIGMALLGLASCQGGDEATSVDRNTTTAVVTTTSPPEQVVLTAEDRLLRWIRSCEVRELIFTHEGVTVIRFEHGGTVRLQINESAEEKIHATAFSRRCPDGKRIVVGIE
jgi:hypothetical protein